MQVWLDISQISVLGIWSIHVMPKILLRHLLENVCRRFNVVFVVRQVSAPYNRTDLTHALKILILVLLPMSLAFHTFLRFMKATLAFCILAPMSSSVPPFLLMMLPRYVKESTSAIGLSWIRIGSVLLPLIFNTFVFPG